MAVFVVASLAAGVQLVLYARLAHWEKDCCGGLRSTA